MIDNDEVKDPRERVVTLVNHQALNSWLLFGTTSPPETKGKQHPLVGTAKFRWAGQRARSKKSGLPEKKK